MNGLDRLMKMAVIFNIAGVTLLSISLFVETPFQLTLTMAGGCASALIGFGIWVKMVIDEALSRGMLE
ncbi:MAG: hypothetical protein HZB29_04555 [Nitrospinae bacterium]|nr:hypothetical protein [Nitrospinota bacterium]